MSDKLSNIILWIVAGILIAYVFNLFPSALSSKTTEISFAAFVDLIKSNELDTVTIKNLSIQGASKESKKFKTQAPEKIDSQLIKDMLDNNVKLNLQTMTGQHDYLNTILNLLPWFILFGIWIYIIKNRIR